jgi:DNA-binding LacI/PurR family transcriptional regulator
MEEYTIVDAAKILGVSKDTVRRRIKAGDIKAELRKSPFGKDMYYIKPIELTGAVKNVNVVKVERTLTPDELQGIFQQAMQQVVEPLHKEIAALRAELKERDREVMERIREIQQEQQRPRWKKFFGV